MVKALKFMYYAAGSMLLVVSAIVGSFAIGIGLGIVLKLGAVTVHFSLNQ
jgi:hypothetical protein